MKDKRPGFTLVEVSLFLAITALLFFGVTLGVRGSMLQQRYNDSVQSFVEFLRSVYSEVTNVEHSGGGNTEKVVYGKLISFGEKKNLSGNNIASDDTKVFSYTVVGQVAEIDGSSDANAVGALADLGGITVEKESGLPREYTTKWGAGIQTDSAYSDGYQSFRGLILIVRHPYTGTINTFFYDLNSSSLISDGGVNSLNDGKNLFEVYPSSGWVMGEEIDLCVNPLGNAETNMRRDVRIKKNARDASSIELVNQDDREAGGEGNRCKR